MISYIIGIASIVGLMVIWVAIQERWKRSFAEESLHDDALAGRTSCSGDGKCGCNNSCSRSTLIEHTSNLKN